MGFNSGLKWFKNKRKENTFFLPSPPSDVDTVVVELKLSGEVILQRLFSCALEARWHPDVSKGVYSFVLTFKKNKKTSHPFKEFILGDARLRKSDR